MNKEKDDKYKKAFAERLQKYMKAMDKTQTDIMKDLGVPSPTISMWVRGQRLPRMASIQMLADYLHVEKSDLLEDEKPSMHYINRDAISISEFLYHHPEYKTLWDSMQNVPREDIGFTKELIDRLNRNVQEEKEEV